jgi:gluconokinase
MSVIIGIDIGTTHTKAIILGIDGKVIFEKKETYPSFQPEPGHHEQNPIEIYNAFIKVLKEALKHAGDQSLISGISFSSAMHGFMAVDDDGLPLTPFITWADIRSQKYAQELKSTDLGRTLHQRTGTAVHPMSPLCKIAWLRNEQADIFRRAAKFISVKEFIFHRFFGEYVIDYSVASATGMLETLTLNWLPEALVWAGITEEHLSRPVSTDFRAELKNNMIAEQIGLTASIPFFIGSSDGCLAVLGSGAILPNEVALTIGTSGAVRQTVQRPTEDRQQRLFNYVLEEGWYISGGASNNGGNVPQWFSEALLDHSFDSDEAFEWYMTEAQKAPVGSDGLMFLPFIYGERAPVWDAEARGQFVRVTGLHNKSHFMRAILEGICLSMNELLLALEENGSRIDTVYASGGFSKSPFWLQIMADVTGKNILISEEGDASAIGAAFIGLKAAGLIHSLHEVKQLTHTGNTISPDAETHARYKQSFDRFRKMIRIDQDLR